MYKVSVDLGDGKGEVVAEDIIYTSVRPNIERLSEIYKYTGLEVASFSYTSIPYNSYSL